MLAITTSIRATCPRPTTKPARCWAYFSSADRCEYRLKQADIHNFLARLALDTGDRAAAHGHAAIARERAWCDGPPHCYKPALDEAERLIGELERGRKSDYNKGEHIPSGRRQLGNSCSSSSSMALSSSLKPLLRKSQPSFLIRPQIHLWRCI
jgi:hypothetical protein